MNRLWWLKGFDPLQTLDGEDRQAVQALLEERYYRFGQNLLSTSDTADTIHWLRSGSAQIVRPSQSGNPITLDTLWPGDLLGQTPLLTEGSREAIAKAQSEVYTATLSKASLELLLKRHPGTHQKLIRMIEDRLKRNRIRQIKRTYRFPPFRLLRLLRQLAREYGQPTPQGVRLEARLTNHELAVAIGASRDAAAEILEQFQAEGVLIVDGKYWWLEPAGRDSDQATRN